MNLSLNNKYTFEEIFNNTPEAYFGFELDYKFNYLIHCENLSALKTLLKTDTL